MRERERETHRAIVVVLVVSLSSAIASIVVRLPPRTCWWRGSAVSPRLVPLTKEAKRDRKHFNPYHIHTHTRTMSICVV